MGFLKLKEIFVLALFVSVAQPKPVHEPKPEYEKRGQVVFLGDSITDWWRNDGQFVWAEYYEPLGAVNTGVAGWTTQNIIDGINGGMIDNLNAYQAVLKIGTNDLAWAGVPEDTVVSNIQNIIGMIRAKNPGCRVILLGILPRGEADIHQRCRNVNARIQAFADDQTVFWLDMEEQFGTGLGQVRPELYWADQLHLSAAGYSVWAETMAPLFNRVLATPFPSKVVWMGDSLSSQWMSVGRQIWDQTYAGLQTNNLAVSGHTSIDTLRLIEGDGVLQGLNPKAVVLMIGGNDLQDGNQAPEIIERIQRIVGHFRSNFAHARILLLGLLPAIGVPDVVIEQGKMVNDALSQMNDNDNIRYLDMRLQFADENEVPYPELYNPDGIHLSVAGYQVWADTMTSHLTPLLEFN